MSSAIYVETRVESSLEELWQKTQSPKLHEKWDLRFSEIDYLPVVPDAPQRYVYRTRIGFGLEIAGEGETVGEKVDANSRTSALKFWSDDPRSLIREGSGYWKYEETDQGVRFFTAYDYRVRFGWLGRAFDKFAFRPLMGWATAWSFDRLRLWVDKEIDPKTSLEKAMTHGVARLALAFAWIYHGLIPKILFLNSGELELLQASPFMSGANESTLRAVGSLEIVWAIVLILAWNQRKVLLFNAFLTLALTAVVFWQPSTLVDPFNPLTQNLCLISLAIVGYLSGKNLPSARRCLRKPQTTDPSTKSRLGRIFPACTR